MRAIAPDSFGQPSVSAPTIMDREEEYGANQLTQRFKKKMAIKATDSIAGLSRQDRLLKRKESMRVLRN